MAASGVRSSWLASAANRRSRASLAARRARAASTCSSIRLNAAPTWPTSVRGFATAQPRLGDPAGGGRHPAERAQRQPHESSADEASQQQGRGERDELGYLHLSQRRLHVGQRQAGDDDVTVLAGGGRQPVVATDRLQVQGVISAVVRQPRQRGFVRGRPVEGGGPPDDAVGGHGAVVQPGAERARRLSLVAILWRAARRLIVKVSRLTRVRSLYAGDVTPARGEQLIVELVDQGMAQHQVGDEADAGAGQREQRDKAEDEPPAQGTRGQPAARAHQPAGLSTYPTPRTVWISGSRSASIFLRR